MNYSCHRSQIHPKFSALTCWPPRFPHLSSLCFVLCFPACSLAGGSAELFLLTDSERLLQNKSRTHGSTRKHSPSFGSGQDLLCRLKAELNIGIIYYFYTSPPGKIQDFSSYPVHTLLAWIQGHRTPAVHTDFTGRCSSASCFHWSGAQPSSALTTLWSLCTVCQDDQGFQHTPVQLDE